MLRKVGSPFPPWSKRVLATGPSTVVTCPTEKTMAFDQGSAVGHVDAASPGDEDTSLGAAAVVDRRREFGVLGRVRTRLFLEHPANSDSPINTATELPLRLPIRA